MITKDEMIEEIMPWLPPAATPPAACIDPWTPLTLRGLGNYDGGRHQLDERWILDVTNCVMDAEAPLRRGDLVVWLGEVNESRETAVFAPARVVAVEALPAGRERVWSLHDPEAGGTLGEGCSGISGLPNGLLDAVRNGPRGMSPEDGASLRLHFGQLDRCPRCGGHAQQIAYGYQLPPVTKVMDPAELAPHDLGSDTSIGGCDVTDDNPTWKCLRCNAIG